MALVRPCIVPRSITELVEAVFEPAFAHVIRRWFGNWSTVKETVMLLRSAVVLAELVGTDQRLYTSLIRISSNAAQVQDVCEVIRVTKLRTFVSTHFKNSDDTTEEVMYLKAILYLRRYGRLDNMHDVSRAFHTFLLNRKTRTYLAQSMVTFTASSPKQKDLLMLKSDLPTTMS